MASIFLAVGHGVSTDGSWDCGCTNGNYTEAALMLAIGKKAASLLRQSGITVVTDADTNNDRNMTYTVRDANTSGVDVYVSLHCDYIKAPSGTLPIVFPDSSNGYHLADCIDKAYRKATGLPLRNILERDDYEVTYTDMPACIFETGSIHYDLPVLIKADICAKGIAQGVCDYFGKKLTGTTTATSTKTTKKTTTTTKSTYQWTTENVQYYLNICNYGAPDIDGIWGQHTERCLKIAQKTNGITVDGLWGSQTQAKAEAQIKGIQTQLNRKGFKCGIDGIAGPETYNAVKSFQKANGLIVDGIVGAVTQKALLK